MTPTPPLSRPAVVLDVDSTLYPLLDVMHSLPGGHRVSYAAARSWGHLPKLCGGVPKMLAMFDAAMTPRLMNRHAPFPGAVAAVRQIAVHAKIIVATDRPATCRAATFHWLELHGIPFDDLVCQRGVDKIAVAREHGAQLIIDDHPELIARASACGIRALSLAYPYNRRALARAGAPAPTSWGQLGPLALGALGVLAAA